MEIDRVHGTAINGIVLCEALFLAMERTWHGTRSSREAAAAPAKKWKKMRELQAKQEKVDKKAEAE